MTFENTPLKGLRVIQLPASTDNRGEFVKTLHEPTLLANGIEFDLKESYFSFSHKDVIKGLHFQTPPHEHAKVVFCPQGAILDVAVDLRKDSPTYGQAFSQVLSGENHKAYYIPVGFAHGFKALTEGAL